jgi:hypothetical protein
VIIFFKRICKHYPKEAACVLKSINHPFFSNLNRKQAYKHPNFILDYSWIMQHEKVDYITDIDYFMIFGNDKYFEQVFANRTRILDLCSNNCIVITNKSDVVGQVAEKYGLAYLVDPYNDSEVQELIDYLIKHRKEVNRKKDVKGFREEYDYKKHYSKLLGIL